MGTIHLDEQTSVDPDAACKLFLRYGADALRFGPFARKPISKQRRLNERFATLLWYQIVLVSLLVWAAPAMACAPELDFVLVVKEPPPTIRETYNLDELRSLATVSSQQLRHEAFGFYTSAFRHSISVRQEAAIGSGCPILVAEIWLVLDNRVIQIARDLATHGCQRGMIISHYAMHARDDGNIFRVYAARIFAALKAGSPERFFTEAPQEEAQNAVGAAIEQEVEKVLVPFRHDRAIALTQADTSQEILKLSKACVNAS